MSGEVDLGKARNFEELLELLLEKLDLVKGTDEAEAFTQLLRCSCATAIAWVIEDLDNEIDIPAKGDLEPEMAEKFKEDIENTMIASILTIKAKAIVTAHALGKSILTGKPKEDPDTILEQKLDEAQASWSLFKKKLH